MYSYYIGWFSPYGHVNEAEFFKILLLRFYFYEKNINGLFLIKKIASPPKVCMWWWEMQHQREKSAVEATIWHSQPLVQWPTPGMTTDSSPFGVYPGTANQPLFFWPVRVLRLGSSKDKSSTLVLERLCQNFLYFCIDLTWNYIGFSHLKALKVDKENQIKKIHSHLVVIPLIENTY